MAVRVLVVDDQHQLRVLVRRFFALEERAIEVVGEAATAAEAVAVAGGVTADVAVVDANLPDGDGIALARALRELQPGLRTVLFTGHVDDAVQRAADAAGVDAVVTKGEVADLAQTVARIVDGA